MAVRLPNQYRSYLKYALLALLAIVLAGALGSYLLGNRLQQRLQEVEGLTYEQLEVDILDKTFALKKAHYQEIVNASDTTDVYCGLAKIDGIEWLPLLWRKSLRLEQITIDSLVGVVFRDVAAEETTNQSIFNSLVRSFSVQDVFFENIHLEYNRKKEWIVKTEKLKLHLEALEYTPEDLDFQHFTISTNNTVWTPNKGDYAWRFQQFDIDTRKGQLAFTNLQLQPLHDKYDWQFQHEFRQSRLDWEVASLTGYGFQIDKWINAREFQMDSVAIEDAALHVWIDKRMTECLDCPNRFVHRRLLETDQPILIKKLLCRNHDLDIEVLSSDTDKKINVGFQNIYASIYDISNLDAHVQEHSNIVADVQATFNETAQLNAHFTFDLTDPNFGYTYEATLDRLPLVSVNDLFAKGAKMQVTSGTLNQLRMTATGNEQALQGDLNFNYEDLAIQLLDEENKPKKILSFLANKTVINSDNSIEEKGYKSGSMYYERVPHKSIFHQWWGGIRSGLRSTLLPNILLPEELEHEKPNK